VERAIWWGALGLLGIEAPEEDVREVWQEREHRQECLCHKGPMRTQSRPRLEELIRVKNRPASEGDRPQKNKSKTQEVRAGQAPPLQTHEKNTVRDWGVGFDEPEILVQFRG